MSVGMGLAVGREQLLNRAFAYIYKNSPSYVYVRKQYQKLKCKDLTKTACVEDLIIKADCVKIFHEFTKIDMMAKKRQDKWKEFLTIGKK